MPWFYSLKFTIICAQCNRKRMELDMRLGQIYGTKDVEFFVLCIGGEKEGADREV